MNGIIGAGCQPAESAGRHGHPRGHGITHTRYPLVDLRALHGEIGAELEEAVLAVVRGGRLVGGEPVADFESAFGAYLGVAEVVGVANGTDALELALRALGIGAGAEVLVPANSFIATASAVVAAGATPRFVDVHPEHGLIDLDGCQERLTPATQAIIPVHLYGRMVDMEPVLAFAARHGLAVVEDAAQAHGAQRDGRRAGSLGHVGCFSFYPGKNLGALGDGGAVVSGDPALAARVRLLANHGRAGAGHQIVGRNSRLDALHAAVLSVKLRHLDAFNARRAQVARRYRAALPAELLDGRVEPPGAEAHHLFPILSETRDGLAARLAADGVQTGIHYAQALPDTAAFGACSDACPVATHRAAWQLSLPMHPHLEADDVEFIAGRVTGAIPVGRP